MLAILLEQPDSAQAEEHHESIQVAHAAKYNSWLAVEEPVFEILMEQPDSSQADEHHEKSLVAQAAKHHE